MNQEEGRDEEPSESCANVYSGSELGGKTWVGRGGGERGTEKTVPPSLKLFKGGEWPSSSSRMNCDRAEVILLEKCSSPRFTLETGVQAAMQFFSLLFLFLSSYSSFFFSFFLFFFFNSLDSVTVNLFSNGGTSVEFWIGNLR